MNAPGLVATSSSCYVPVCVVASGLLGKLHSFQELSAQSPHLGDQSQQRCFCKLGGTYTASLWVGCGGSSSSATRLGVSGVLWGQMILLPLCPQGTSWEANDLCQGQQPSTDNSFCSCLFLPYPPANLTFAHKASPCTPVALRNPFPGFCTLWCRLWWGNSLESLFRAQKCVFHPIHISCSSHLIFWRFLIPDVTRHTHSSYWRLFFL